MSKAYQLLEPNCLGMLPGRGDFHEFVVGVYHWLLPRVRAVLANELNNVEIDIIRAEYHGRYPAIGIHYKCDNSQDVGPLIERAIEQIIHETSISDFIDSTERSDVSWKTLAADIMDEPSTYKGRG